MYYSNDVAISEADNKLFSKTFLLMFIGLMITAISSFAFVSIIHSISSIAVFILFLVEFAIVGILSVKVEDLSTSAAVFLFIIFSALNGITCSGILLYYELASIAYTFIIAAVIFGAMGIYGYYTKRDLNKLAPYLLFGLLGALIVLVVNLFLGNTLIDIIISVIVIILMMGCTAFDIYTMKHNKLYNTKNAYVFFALSLYLDFINIFLYLLKFTGKKK